MTGPVIPTCLTAGLPGGAPAGRIVYNRPRIRAGGSMIPHLDLKTVILTVGYIGLFAIVFAESGLFFGFFLPGDSLLFTAGFLASQGFFDLTLLMVLLSIAAIAGDSVGYWSGEKFGRRLFRREDSIWFHKKHLVTAHEFYEKHGGKAIILARFLPAVRTFVPIVAGMAQMSYRKFLSFNVFGGLFWVIGLAGAGYVFGNVIPDVDRYLIPVVLLIIVVSALPTAIHLYRENRHGIHTWIRSRLARPVSSG
jgi:membrane-associated protein